MCTVEMDRGLLVIGHGTRDLQGQNEFWSTVNLVERFAAGRLVEGCFLEMAAPTIEAAVARAYERGVRKLVVAPLLLFAADHARRDIPAAVAAACQRFPELRTTQVPPLGLHPRIVELSCERFDEALIDRDPAPDEKTVLVLIGRGSRDVHAVAEMHRFAALRQAAAPAIRVETSFLAIASPSLPEALDAAARDYSRIIVQPHLLFAGQLIDDIYRALAVAMEAHPNREWILAPRIGVSSLAALALVENAGPP